MTEQAAALPHERYCGKRNRAGRTCRQPAGWGTDHTGVGACKLHGGKSLVRHGRYSQVKHVELREIAARHEADEAPLDIFPELAQVRALYEDYINRYYAYAAALLAWHESWKDGGARKLTELDVQALEVVVDELEVYAAGQDDPGDEPGQVARAITRCRNLLTMLRQPPDDRKPTQILDIADAYRILSEVTKIAERIERIRAANAISRPDLMRLMQEMGRVVTHHVTDPEVQKAIKDDWLSIRVA